MFKERPACLVAIPESDEFAPIRQAIMNQLQDHDVEPLTYPAAALSSRGSSASLEAVERSDMLIADVTDKNPNILYELGIADAMRKPVLILAQKSHDVLSELAGHRVLLYEPNDIDTLSRYLDYWIQDQSLNR